MNQEQYVFPVVTPLFWSSKDISTYLFMNQTDFHDTLIVQMF